MNKFKLLVFFLIVQSGIAHAGLDWTTVHSRANCLNNESITWWYLHSFNWRVVSIHEAKYGNAKHHIDTGFNWTWRAHAIHWGEPFGNDDYWCVSGYHYLFDYSKYIPFDTTYAESCNIIDGW